MIIVSSVFLQNIAAINIQRKTFFFQERTAQSQTIITISLSLIHILPEISSKVTQWQVILSDISMVITWQAFISHKQILTHHPKIHWLPVSYTHLNMDKILEEGIEQGDIESQKKDPLIEKAFEILSE